jgi:hypothetical protein
MMNELMESQSRIRNINGKRTERQVEPRVERPPNSPVFQSVLILRRKACMAMMMAIQCQPFAQVGQTFKNNWSRRQNREHLQLTQARALLSPLQYFLKRRSEDLFNVEHYFDVGWYGGESDLFLGIGSGTDQ